MGNIEFPSSDDFQHASFSQQLLGERRPSFDSFGPVPYAEGPGTFPATPYFEQSHRQHGSVSLPYDQIQRPSPQVPEISYSTEPFSDTSHQSLNATETPESWHSDQYSPEALGSALGDLKIDEAGVGKSHAACRDL